MPTRHRREHSLPGGQPSYGAAPHGIAMEGAKLLPIVGVPYALAAMSLLLISLPLPLISAEFGLPGPLAGFLGGSVFIGMLLGAVTFGPLADRIGRKLSLEAALATLGTSTALCSLAADWAQLVAFRVLAGVGIGSTIPLCFVYLAEFTEPSTRGRTLVLLDSFWAYGWIAATILGYLVIPAYGWRAYFAASAAPVLALVPALHAVLRETPMYSERAARGRRSVLDSLKALWARGMRRVTASTWLMWFSIVFGYYSFFLWIVSYMRRMGYPLPQAYWYSMVTSFAQIPGYFAAAYLVDRWGRRPTLTSFSLATAASLVMFSLSRSPTELVLWLSMVCFFCLGAWGVVMCYTAEPYPTPLRGTGYGFASGFGRLAGIVGPTAVGLMLSCLGVAATVQAVSLLFVILAADMLLLGVETKGRELE